MVIGPATGVFAQDEKTGPAEYLVVKDAQGLPDMVFPEGKQPRPRDLVAWITDESFDDNLRSAAAVELIRQADKGSQDAYQPILKMLGKDQPAELRGFLIDAIGRAEVKTAGAKLADALYQIRDTLSPELEARWATALGRWELDGITNSLARITQNNESKPEQRRVAILALGEHRTKPATKALMELVKPGLPEATRKQAYAALGNLSHQPGLGRDDAKWAKWYQQVQGLDAGAWNRMIHTNLLLLSRGKKGLDDGVRERLIQAQRALYRVTPEDQRPAVLIEMLRDPMDIIRELAMAIARQRAEDDGDFGEPLRNELRARLKDPLPKVHEEAATLLGQLLDGKAADEMAKSLSLVTLHLKEHPGVARAYLNALTQMPRESAAGSAYELLENTGLRAAAAGMLAASHRADHGDEGFWKKVRGRVWAQIKDIQAPEPQMVALLGLVIEADDNDAWERIGEWLDAEDDRLREAAARVWAGSSRSLVVLAERCGDAVVRPIALKAIAERGTRKETLKAVAAKRPEQADSIRLWEKAMVALAGRVAPDALLDVIETLTDDNGQTRQVRENMLTASINRKAKPDTPTRDELRLLIARAQTRVPDDAPALVVKDYEAALKDADKLTKAQAEQARRGLVGAYLIDNRAGAALTLANTLIRPGGELIENADTDPLIDRLALAAKKAVEQSRKDDATALITGIRTLLGESISEDRAAQLKAINDALAAGSSESPGS